MAKVLITGAGALSCVHKFPIPATGSAQLTVGGIGVLTRSVVLATLPACKVPVSQGVTPCTKVLTMDGAKKLTVGSDQVVLDIEQGTTNGADGALAPNITAKALQTKLTAT
jgi:hypothetical protein